MKTPIVDFVNRYNRENGARMHMPGHKGRAQLGFEELDITEISGADSLYEASGIIKESEENASRLFGCKTFYSTEGSSQCIRAMLYLAYLYAKENNKAPTVAALRNVHKTFLSGAALVGLEVDWIYGNGNSSYLSCSVTASEIEDHLAECEEKPAAVYLTSPDYLGNILDIKGISEACEKYGVLLLVDNAHGAYLKFLKNSEHPIDHGAHLCCDSAHKTLPALTGAAYLHVSHKAPGIFSEQAKNALAMFGSTSPSYLILQSLDKTNEYLASGYERKLSETAERIKSLKDKLEAAEYKLCGNEALKITVMPKSRGYRGTELADILFSAGIVCEFADPDQITFMLSPENTEKELDLLERELLSLEAKAPLSEKAPAFHKCKKVLSVREAMLSVGECVKTEDAVNRVLVSPSVGCPPAVPIVVCGELVDETAVEIFKYYGIKECTVKK